MTPAGTSNELDVQNGWEENTQNTQSGNICMYGQDFKYEPTAQAGEPRSIFRDISEHGRVADVPSILEFYLCVKLSAEEIIKMMVVSDGVTSSTSLKFQTLLTASNHCRHRVDVCAAKHHKNISQRVRYMYQVVNNMGRGRTVHT